MCLWHAHIRTYITTYIHRNKHTYTQIYIHTHKQNKNAYMHTHVHAHTHTHIHAYPRSPMHICTHSTRWLVTIVPTTHATHCNTYTLRCTTTRCRTLQRTAAHCNILQVCCSTLQHTAPHCKHTAARGGWRQSYTRLVQHTATYCNTLQHTATDCTTLQHTTARGH